MGTFWWVFRFCLQLLHRTLFFKKFISTFISFQPTAEPCLKVGKSAFTLSSHFLYTFIRMALHSLLTCRTDHSYYPLTVQVSSFRQRRDKSLIRTLFSFVNRLLKMTLMFLRQKTPLKDHWYYSPVAEMLINCMFELVHLHTCNWKSPFKHWLLLWISCHSC